MRSPHAQALRAARHPACEGRFTAAQILSHRGGDVIGRFSDQSQNGLLDSDRVAAPQANFDGGWRLARADTFNRVFKVIFPARSSKIIYKVMILVSEAQIAAPSALHATLVVIMLTQRRRLAPEPVTPLLRKPTSPSTKPVREPSSAVATACAPCHTLVECQDISIL